MAGVARVVGPTTTARSIWSYVPPTHTAAICYDNDIELERRVGMGKRLRSANFRRKCGDLLPPGQEPPAECSRVMAHLKEVGETWHARCEDAPRRKPFQFVEGSWDLYVGIARNPAGGYLAYGRITPASALDRGLLMGAETSFAIASSDKWSFWRATRHVALASGGADNSSKQNAAHNLFALSEADSRRLGGGNTLFAVGGEYREGYETMTGIHLMELASSGAIPQWTHRMKLVDGRHPGCVERRRHLGGVCEFDGLTSMVWFNGMWRLYARANTGLSGHRGLQTCAASRLAPAAAFGRFNPVRIEGHEDGDDIYFMHAYALPGGGALMGIVSVAFTRSARGAKEGGVYACVSRDGIRFGPLKLLLSTRVDGPRTIDLPVAGVEWLGPHTFEFAMHRNVPGRMNVSEPAHLTWHTGRVPESPL